MATVSSLGIGSGLDLNTLLAGIKTGEQAPLVALQQQQTSYTSKLSAYGQLNSALSGLQAAAAALALPALFQGVTANSTASDVVTATALSTATTGSYAVNVTQLTQAQSLATVGQSSTATYGAGSVTIQFGAIATNSTSNPADTTGKYTLATPNADGTYTAATFIPNPTPTPTPTPIAITIAAGSTLANIRDAINKAVPPSGVTASIVNDGSATPNRLVLTSNQTGETSSMKITVGGGDTALTGLLAYDPAVTPAAQMQQTVAAQNTKLTVNGIAITSATNTVAGAIQDVTLTVAKVSPLNSPSTLSVQKDINGAGSAIQTFVNAYNSLQSVATTLTAFDATSKSGAVLLGDSTLRNIQVRIRSALTSAQKPDASGLATLTQVGIGFQKDGTLSFDATKLRTVLGSQMSGVANLFAGSAGVGGYGTQLSSLITGMTDATTGTLTAATKGINTTLDSLGKQYTATSARIDATMARYKAQFTQLDTLISNMNQTSSYLTKQFAPATTTN